MQAIRKLQHIGKQHFLNVPAGFLKGAQWRKGDYIQIAQRSINTFDLRKIGEGTMSKDEVELAALKQEKAVLDAALDAGDAAMEGGKFSFYLADHTRVMAKIRRVKRKINARTIHGINATTKVA